MDRALSKLGLLSRARAADAIRAGRVAVNGRVVRDPATLVIPERARVAIDGEIRRRREVHRTIALHKPRGVVTTRRDPEGRPTVFDLLGEVADGLVAVGRLDLATSGLLLLTSDTQLANRLSDPRSGVPRVYIVTVRGRVEEDDVETLMAGVMSRGERMQPSRVVLQKASGRESRLLVELREGKNREIRRLVQSIGLDVSRLKRVSFGNVALGDLAAGAWRELNLAEIAG